MLDEDPTLECTNLFQHSLLAMPAAPVSTVACDLAWRWFDVISYRGSQPPSFVDVARARIPYLRGLKLANDKTGSAYLLSRACGRIGGYHSAPTGAKRRIYDRPAMDYSTPLIRAACSSHEDLQGALDKMRAPWQSWGKAHA